ncbi:MAG: DUF2061 domain-containing protein [Bradyrhizobiaceae bacterium]|nr:MAG: DUF2061 domain-containing protein [Bradyrhizobiaceae bacterium]
MNIAADPVALQREALLLEHENKGLLRFIACGSVDHGKSSLLGRLLFEAKLVLEDQIETLKKDSGASGENELDYSLLFDGLAAEREQKITIDLAYRFFSTDKRKFIVADAPGHEQYTRNMATGASTADLALLLVAAPAGLTDQTQRHALIAATFGVRHLVVAINKMDLVDFSRSIFDAIEADFRLFARQLGDISITFIPVSARGGDNIVNRSQNMRWYKGKTLLETLETVDISDTSHADDPFRLAVQWVNRPNADFRGYSGTIASGEIVPGAEIVVQPSGRRSHVAQIVTADGPLKIARTDQAVTLTLTDEIDISRGDLISGVTKPARVADRIRTRLFWMDPYPLNRGRRYYIKVGTASATAALGSDIELIDLSGHSTHKASELPDNTFGVCDLVLDRQLAFDTYENNRRTGALILIDPETNGTVAMGLIERQQDSGDEEPHKNSGIPLVAFASRLKATAGQRAIESVLTFMIAWAVTGNPKASVLIAVVDFAARLLIENLRIHFQTSKTS